MAEQQGEVVETNVEETGNKSTILGSTVSFKEREFVNTQSVLLSGDNEERIRRSPCVKDNQFVEYYYEDAKTMHDCFLKGLELSGNGNCLGWRNVGDQHFTWLSYQEVWQKIKKTGSGLAAKGLKEHGKVGVFAKNCVEWFVVDKACGSFQMISVPLYDTLGEEAIKHIINLCKLEVICLDSNDKALKILSYVKDEEVSGIRLLVMKEEVDEDTKSALEKCEGVEIISYDDLEQAGSENNVDPIPPKPDDVYTIAFTSGTTGKPKGVLTTHKMVVANASSLLAYTFKNICDVSKEDVHLSYLPMPHAFERVAHVFLFMRGAQIGFFGGDIKNLMADAQALKPTSFNLVPRLMNKLYDNINATVNQSFIKAKIFNFVLNKKLATLKKGIIEPNKFLDKVAFGKVRAMLGGRVKLCITGAAPLSGKILNFQRCVLGISIIEGFGQTELSAGVSTTVYGDYEGGNVGSVMPCGEVKLVDVEEKGYFSKDDCGEVCVRGPSAMLGYYLNEDETKKTIDEEGWVHTGDVGKWLSNGALCVVDRKKNIFKLSQGEYVSPERVEQVYVLSVPVLQIYIHGDSFKASLVALVVPDPESIESWCQQKGVDGSGEFAEVCKRVEVRDAILDDMNKIAKRAGLMSFEIAKSIALCSTPFTVDDNLLTPTLKAKRPQIYAKHKDAIETIYKDAS